MSVITKGKTFANGEQLTAGKLNQMLDAAVFSSAAVDNTKTTLSGGAITIAPNAITSTEIAQSFLDTIYPIGSIYTNATDSTNPGTLLGFGTWEAYGEGRVLVGFGQTTDTRGDTVNFNSIGSTSGEFQHLNTSAESGVPAHTHGGIFPSGGSGSFSQAFDVDNPGSGADLGSEKTTSSNATADASAAHNNMQPYIVVYMWKRTA